MLRTRINQAAWAYAVPTVLALAAAVGASYIEEGQSKDSPPVAKAAHVPEVRALLGNLAIDKPRTHKNMVVFPLRFSGKQAPGQWSTLDDAVTAGQLKVSELESATVPEVRVENLGDKSVLLVSGEIIKGGKQTRTVAKDTVIEARQKVAVAVFCVEQHRWAGGKDFRSSPSMAPASIQGYLKSGAGQGAVWQGVRDSARAVGAESKTESLEEVLQSDKVQRSHEETHKALGRFSPPDTIGIAVADARTGRVVGLELFGRRDLFERLQDKLVEGYATDLVLAAADWKEADSRKVSEDEVDAFIRRALGGTSRYEDTPGSGRGIDLVSGSIRGKGVALGENAIHLSIQDVGSTVTPVRPVVDDRR